MTLVVARRICQVFFFALFLWFCAVMRLGESWHQLRGWPVNWFLNLDPLNGLATVLSTRTLYAGLWWGALVLVLTLVLGRFFCGWVCPFGVLHHFAGYLGNRGKKRAAKIRGNQPHRAQNIKYIVLIFFLAGAFDLPPVRLPPEMLPRGAAIWFAVFILLAGFALVRGGKKPAVITWAALGVFFLGFKILFPHSAFLQTGLLDPIALFHRSVHTAVIPVLQRLGGGWGGAPVHFPIAAGIGLVFLGLVLANLWVPRFFCRFICPAGALFGLVSRFSLYSVKKRRKTCSDCKACDVACQGACRPWGEIRSAECLVCMNCMDVCPDRVMGYFPGPPAAGEVRPDISRRGAVAALATGLFAPAFFRVGKFYGADLSSRAVRPPGALAEDHFLSRCIKCGQCMRICPTNVIRPALLEAGVEGMWTPVLDFTSGTSGCQSNCVACGHLCPTAAIRPLSLEERMGLGEFKDKGPVRIGTAFVDKSRCLPWAMDRPCIVCQENCPVSPKAIFTREAFVAVQGAQALSAAYVQGRRITLSGLDPMEPGRFATGDYHLFFSNRRDHAMIAGNDGQTVELGQGPLPGPGEALQIRIRLQRPQVDPKRCIGCGVCQHECPVLYQKAIYVTAENESRNKDASFLPP